MTSYEWICETVEITQPGDDPDDAAILDTDIDIDLGGLVEHYRRITPDAGTMHRFALVRDSDRDGRQWAYVIDGRLDDLRDAHGRSSGQAPKRFRDAVAKHFQTQETKAP